MAQEKPGNRYAAARGLNDKHAQPNPAFQNFKIAVILGLFSGLASVGGVQLAGREIAAALALIARDRGWPCCFLSLNDARGEQEGHVTDIRFRYTGFARAKARFSFKALQLARGKPKVIFAGHPNLAPVAIMAKTIGNDARTIVGAHGIEVWRPLPIARRKMLRCADVVVAPSAHTAQQLETVQCVTAQKIRRLPWPLDPEFAELTRNANQLEKFPEGQVVLSVGRWDASERYKGADLLIQAIAELSWDFHELQLLLLGSGDDLPRLRQLAQTLRVGERVHFLTEFSRKQLAACYAAADIFALPSAGEGFGLVFLEAMAFGKPVIGTNIGGIPDIVEDGQQGLLIETNVAALSSALRKLLSDRALCLELGARARERVEREFTFEKFQQRLREIVESILEEQILPQFPKS